MTVKNAGRGNPDAPSEKGSPPEVARYISDICLELRNLAAGARLDMLAHILDMAVEEGDEVARK